MTARSGLKVLCVGLARRGGMLHFHDCLVEGLAPVCQVASLTAAGADHGERVAFQKDVRHFFVDSGKGMIGTLGKLTAPKTWKAVQTAIESFRPDLVHFTGAQEWNPAVGALLKKRGIPLLYTVHDVIHHEGVPFYFRVTEGIFRKLPDGFIVLTESAKAQLSAQGVAPERIRVIPHGVYDFFHDTPALAAEPDDPNPFKRVLFFGRIEPYKGLPILLEAIEPLFEKYPDWGLTIAGSGDVSGLRDRLNRPQIELINRFLSDAEVAALMRRAEIIALPYLSATQSGVIPTAFPFAKAILATAVGGIPDMIRDDENGLLAAANDAEGFRNGLERLMRDAALRRRLGEAGAAFAKERLGWDAIAARHLDFYEEILFNLSELLRAA